MKSQRILMTGVCGFVGSTIARNWIHAGTRSEIIGIDNLSRTGSAANAKTLRRLGVKLHHGDLRVASDVDALPAVDAVIDAAANPSVLAGTDGRTSSRQVVEHNLVGTLNLLEYCRRCRAKFILLSTSRVYAIDALNALPLRETDGAYTLDTSANLPPGVSEAGLSESFAATPPLSLYGATKAASEIMALEYGEMFEFPVWINRCGVLAGARQLGHAEQGIVSYWIHAWQNRRPLRYLGFGGRGAQVRDVLHPDDLMPVLDAQLATDTHRERVCNLGGGAANAVSLRQLSGWCEMRFGPHDVQTESATRSFDVPWVVMDSTRARDLWEFEPKRSLNHVLDEIADFAEAHPNWLDDAAP